MIVVGVLGFVCLFVGLVGLCYLALNKLFGEQ